MVLWRISMLVAVVGLLDLGTGLDWQNHGFLHPLPIADVDSKNPLCREDSLLLVSALQNRTLWAEQMWDSSAKTPVGLLTGTKAQFGNFDECLEVNQPIQSRYCLVSLRLDVPPGHDTMDPEASSYPANISAWEKIYYGGSKAKQRLDRIKMALCVPRSCEPGDIEDWVARHLAQTEQPGVQVTVEEWACSIADDPEYNFTTGDLTFCVLMLAAFFLVTSATIYDLIVYEYDSRRPPANFVQCLSAHRGLRSLLKKDQGVAGLQLDSLYGVHVFSFFFIVLGHRFGYYMCTTIINYEDVEYMFRNVWLSMWTGHMDLFCDIFFYLSAFLLGVILSLQLDKGYISPIKVYVHRVVRLLPAYSTMVFFYATLYYKIGSGPAWNAVIKREQDQCKEFWWVNLLFLNNYLGGDKMCLLQSWYIACDFQLFLVGTLLVLLLNRHPRLGLSVSGVLLVASVLTPFLGTYLYNRPALLTFYKQMWENVRHVDLYVSVYSQAHYRGAGYLVGLLAGYCVFKKRGTQLTKRQTWVFISAGYSIATLTYFSGALFTDTARPYSPLESALYAATNHTVFAIGLTLSLVGVIFGTKTFVSDIFGWHGFVPLSKLSYSMYLVHNMPQIANAAATRTVQRFDLYGLMSGTISDLVVGLALSLVLYLFIESPCRYLFKRLTSPTSGHQSVESSEDVKDVKEVTDWSYRLTNP